MGLTADLLNDACDDRRVGFPPRSGRSWPSPRPPPQTSASPTSLLAARDVGMSSACSLNTLPTRGDPREPASRDAAHPLSQPPSTESSETAHRHVGEAANASTRDEPLAALAAAEDITGAARGRWVNPGLVQDEYHDNVVAGRPANSSPDGNSRPCLRPDLTIKRRDHGTADRAVFKDPHQQGGLRVTRTVRARASSATVLTSCSATPSGRPARSDALGC